MSSHSLRFIGRPAWLLPGIAGVLLVTIGSAMWIRTRIAHRHGQGAASEVATHSAGNLATVAEISDIQGSVLKRSVRNSLLSPVSNGPLQLQEILQTEADSTARLQLQSGAEFELEPSSRIVIERENQVLNLIVLQGDLKLLAAGEATKYRVFQDGRTLGSEELLYPRLPNGGTGTREVAKDDGATHLNPNANSVPVLPHRAVEAGASTQIPEVVPVVGDEATTTTSSATSAHSGSGVSASVDGSAAANSKANSKEDSAPHDTLSSDQINKTVKSQTSFLHRCYINYMIKSQKAGLSGRINMAFRIEPSGAVRDPRIVQSPFQDETLNRCLSEVFERTRFPSFTGKEIQIDQYPLDLD